jgi:uridine kinase
MFSADADVRLARRIKRDTADNARNIEAVLDQVATSSYISCALLSLYIYLTMHTVDTADF